ncbi:MAG: hypothetical protein ACI8X3_002201 [Saprospiraceae bacterium]|jgi:hypothetical protein
MENLSFQYPSWYLLLCLLLGLVYAMVLYFRNDAFKDKSRALNWILGTFRFLVVSILGILLMSPFLKSIVREIKKPVIVIAQDQSESILSDMNEEERNQYQATFQQFETALGEEYEIKKYAFGSEVKEGIDFQFTDKVSNISEFLKYIYDLYSNQNLGAVIMASDGIYNEGSNPIYASSKLTAPIYTIALGDTTSKKDVILKRVFHNKIAYLGDKFSIQIDISAKNCTGANTFLNISKVEGGTLNNLERLPIKIDKNDFFTTKEVILDAARSGVQRYRVSINTVPGEVTTINNTKDIFVDVLDARQKILVLANAPHPDLSAIKQSIGKNKNYEVTIAYINSLAVDVKAFDFVVLYQLPSRDFNASAVLATLNERKIPRLFVVGTQSNYNLVTQVQPLVNISADQRNTNEVQAAFAKDFSLFTIDEDLRKELPNFAPLLAPFGDFKENPNATVLLYQRIGKIDTKYPLLILGEQNNTKIGVLCAEGIWKWRLFDYLQHENHDLFDELLGKTFQYLSLKEDKRKFRISLSKNIFNENEELFFDAELYNESYELVNEPDVGLTITNEEGKDFNFTFNRNTSKSYSLNASSFAVGNYTFRGTVNSAGQQLSYDGQFSVQPVQLELYETTANHGLLRMLSEKYGGKLLYPDQLTTLPQLIKDKGTVLPTIYDTSKTRSVMNLRWIFFLLLGLLTAEWFMRRYFGSY